MTTETTERTVTEHEAAQVERANALKATPIVFVHGLWLLPSSWERWVTLFGERDYAAVTPGWPDDPETVTQAREHPEVLAGKGITEIADYEEAIIRRLDRKPVIIGHSFGGLLTMILAGRGLATASIAISPAPFRACSRCRSLHCGQPAWHCAIPRTGTEPSERGPMLIVSADSDHTVPWAIANAAYKKQKRNEGAKRFTSVPVQHDNLRERR